MKSCKTKIEISPAFVIFHDLFWQNFKSTSHELCTWFVFCCVLLRFSTDILYPYPSGLLHWHWGNHMIAPVPVKQPWRIWANGFYINLQWTFYITTTKQSTAKPCANFMGYNLSLFIYNFYDLFHRTYKDISMVLRKITVTHWSYRSLAINHRYQVPLPSRQTREDENYSDDYIYTNIYNNQLRLNIHHTNTGSLASSANCTVSCWGVPSRDSWFDLESTLWVSEEEDLEAFIVL